MATRIAVLDSSVWLLTLISLFGKCSGVERRGRSSMHSGIQGGLARPQASPTNKTRCPPSPVCIPALPHHPPPTLFIFLPSTTLIIRPSPRPSYLVSLRFPQSTYILHRPTSNSHLYTPRFPLHILHFPNSPRSVTLALHLPTTTIIPIFRTIFSVSIIFCSI